MPKAELKILEAERLHQPTTTSANTVPKMPLQQRQRDDYLIAREKEIIESELSLKCPWYNIYNYFLHLQNESEELNEVKGLGQLENLWVKFP